ncbi:MAG: hypothetical protein KU29_07205 [Sulfurovum sp. FS06-10]|nr:MAG: hypothetical protein KU29_07205 [Sulfurovum sp. FS06-10]
MVGTIINARKTLLSDLTTFCSLFSSGRIYEAVLPVPDFEAPIMSNPFKAKGMTLVCMAVVWVYFSSEMAFKISGCKFSFSNDLMMCPFKSVIY